MAEPEEDQCEAWKGKNLPSIYQMFAEKTQFNPPHSASPLFRCLKSLTFDLSANVQISITSNILEESAQVRV